MIVITGHSDERLGAFVRMLGEANVFKGNLVIFNSCETPLTDRLVREMNTRFGAIGALQHDGKIKPADVEDFLSGLIEQMKKEPRLPLWRQVLNTMRDSPLNAVWSVSRAPAERSESLCA